MSHGLSSSEGPVPSIVHCHLANLGRFQSQAKVEILTYQRKENWRKTTHLTIAVPPPPSPQQNKMRVGEHHLLSIKEL